MKKILVVAPHPDDETLGCGGTLLKHRHDGDAVHWLLVTGKGGAADNADSATQARAEEIDQVRRCYGFAEVFQFDIAAARVDEYSAGRLVGKVGEVVKLIAPHTVYIPFKGDVHTDHKIIFDVMASCTKTFRFPSVRRVLCYETVSETDFGIDPTEHRFTPNVFVDITPYLEEKIRIMGVYANEIKCHPFPRSAKAMRALAVLRGAAAGCMFAESFMLLKEMVE